MAGIVPTFRIQIEPRFGKQPTMVDGVSVQASANEQKSVSYSLPQSFHLDELLIQWKDFTAGDRGWLALTHPVSGVPAADPAGTAVDVGGYSTVFDPAAGAIAVEFWNVAGDELLEVVPIVSLDGTVLTLASEPDGDYTTANVLKARLQNFHPVRGVKGIDGGFFMLGDGQVALGSSNEQTDEIPAGLLFEVGIDVGGGGAQRHFSVNFVFRTPEQA